MAKAGLDRDGQQAKPSIAGVRIMLQGKSIIRFSGMFAHCYMVLLTVVIATKGTAISSSQEQR